VTVEEQAQDLRGFGVERHGLADAGQLQGTSVEPEFPEFEKSRTISQHLIPARFLMRTLSRFN
jgi:hypothetical protein